MTLVRTLLAIMTALTCLYAPAQAMPRIERAGDWRLVCDNDFGCTILGVPDRPGEVRVVISITRQSGRDAPTLMRMVLLRWDGVPVEDAHLFGFTLDGPGGGHVLRPLGSVLEGIQFFDAEQSEATLDWLLTHRPVRMLQDGSPYALLPSGDLQMLVSSMERRQSSAPGPIAPPPDDGEPLFRYEIRSRYQQNVESLPPEILTRCPQALPENSPAFGLDTVSDPMLIIAARCGRHDALFTWFRGSPPVRERLRDPMARRYRWSRIRYLHHDHVIDVRYGDGRREDCGYRSIWGYSETAGFVQLASWWMPDCLNVPPTLWPQTYALRDWRIL